jgi:hypothetical protein
MKLIVIDVLLIVDEEILSVDGKFILIQLRYLFTGLFIKFFHFFQIDVFIPFRVRG